jgi:pyruvate,water dikinase
MTHPTLAEAPATLLTMVARRMDGNPAETAPSREAAAGREAEARKLLADRPADLARFEERLEAARRRSRYIDETELPVIEALGLVRYVAMEIGRRLVARGAVRAIDDVLFLSDEELLAAARSGRVDADIARRRGEFLWAQSHTPPAFYGPAPAPPPDTRYVPGDARTLMEAVMWFMTHAAPERPAPDADGSLRGIPASPGRVTGTVRVIRDPSEFHRLEPGDVMVCPSTKAVWSVAFPLVSAVVTEHGGPLSHPATLAREFGIPAVVGVPDATRLLHDGQVVTVDGAAGRVG